MEKGKLIIFEGVEKAGKSTQIKTLTRRLASAGINVVLTKEPGGSSRGAEIRQELLFGKPSPTRELELFLEDRSLHFSEKIIPALNAGSWVLCDRCSGSTLAYQGDGRGLDIARIKELDEIARHGQDFDLVILLDMDPVESMRRAEKETRFEKEDKEFHERVRRGYLDRWIEDKKRGKKSVWFCLDASGSEDEVAETIWLEVKRRFLNKQRGGR
ncbi:dTMP kinase [Patescibacteria group bacterium]|nr:dTMP kinase [Patescibacteria group bacterium]